MTLTATTTTTTQPRLTAPPPYLPEVLWAEGSVQVRVNISRALLHGSRVGDERLGFDPSPLDLGAVLHPQVDERHTGHLVAVRPPEDRHLPGRAQANTVVVVVVNVGRAGGGGRGGRGHGCTVRLETLVGRAGFARGAELESFPVGSLQLALFKCWACLRAYVTCPLAWNGQSPRVKSAVLRTTSWAQLPRFWFLVHYFTTLTYH